MPDSINALLWWTTLPFEYKFNLAIKYMGAKWAIDNNIGSLDEDQIVLIHQKHIS